MNGCWVESCQACGPYAKPGAVCPLEGRGVSADGMMRRIEEMTGQPPDTISGGCADCVGRIAHGDGELCQVHAPRLETPPLTPEEQARRDRVTAAITKFQSKPAKPPRRWRR